MSNTTTTARKTRRPSATTQRARLAKAGRPVADDATPKQVVQAYDAWVEAGSPGTPAAAAAKATTPKPAAPKADPIAPANCGCGCGQPTVTAKATFLAGHDARHAGVLGRGLAATPDDADLRAAYERATPALQAKIDKIRATATRKAASKAAQVAAKAAAKKAYDEAMAAIG